MRLLVDRQAAAAGKRRKQLPSLRLIICLVLITINRVRSTCCCSDHRGTLHTMQDHRDQEEPGGTANDQKTHMYTKKNIHKQTHQESNHIHL